MSLTIRPLRVGAMVNYEKSKFAPFGDNYGVKIEAPFICWLIEGASKNILVDTGPCTAKYLHSTLKLSLPLQESPEDILVNRLRSVGMDPKDIDIVILTHLHWDHCFNVEPFVNARFFIQKAEIEYTLDPFDTDLLRYSAPGQGVVPPWFPIWPRLELVEGDYILEPGIEVFHLPGHVPGLQAINVHTDAGRYLLATDAIPLYENWYHPSGHIVSGFCNNLKQTYETNKRIEQITDFVLPGHDKAVFDHEVYGLK